MHAITFQLMLIFFQTVYADTHKPVITLTDDVVAKYLTCAPPLISTYISEQGFATEAKLNYGSFELIRTDIGESDGKLIVKKRGKIVCDINIAMAPDIYFSGTKNLLVIARASGSNDWYSLYNLKNENCLLLGDTSKDKRSYKMVSKLLNPKNGQTICKETAL